MELTTGPIYGYRMFLEPLGVEKIMDDEEKLKKISVLVKELKTRENGQFYGVVSWIQIRKHGNFLLDCLSRQKVEDRTHFFETLACFDSLLSIFKLNLFLELKFTKSFYRNIQREFQLICLQYSFGDMENHQKQQEFHLYSILFLLVMLIYFSGKGEGAELRRLPLQIVNKSFVNSLISLEINVTEKNERILGLVLAYVVKNVNLNVYGEKMFRFIMRHFDKIQLPRTVYHFVYCLREIHRGREIDVRVMRRYDLVGKLWRFWGEFFTCREAVYIADYINVILRKYPALGDRLRDVERLVECLSDFGRIDELSVLHQGLILEIVTKINQSIPKKHRLKMMQIAFETCHRYDFSLKFILCFIASQELPSLLQHIFPFVDSFQSICQNSHLKSILFGLEVLYEVIKKCVKNNAWGVVQALRERLSRTLDDLKEFHVCLRDVARIEECFGRMISMQYRTLC